MLKQSCKISYLVHFSAQAQKTKKYASKKIRFCLSIWNFLAVIFKKNYIFSKESFSYISGNKTLHFSTQAEKILKKPLENFLYFRKRKPKKNFPHFLIFLETETSKKLLIFQEMNP